MFESCCVSIGSGGGNALVFHAFTVIEFKVEDDFTYREVERKTHIKRIENPDDPSQFVDVERIDQISPRHSSIRRPAHLRNQKQRLAMPPSKPVRLDPFQRIVNVGWGKRADFVIFRFRNPLLGGNVNGDQRQNLIRVDVAPTTGLITETGERVGWSSNQFVAADPGDTGFAYQPGVDRLRMYGQTGLAGYREDIFLADLRLIRQQTNSKRIAISSANLDGGEHPFNGSVTLVAQAFLGGAIVETGDDDRVTGSGNPVQPRTLVAAIDGRTFGGGPGQLLAYFGLSTLSFRKA